MNELIIINMFFTILFLFLFSWEVVILFAIRNAAISSKVKTPFGWMVVAIFGILFSLVLVIILISSVLSNL